MSDTAIVTGGYRDVRDLAKSLDRLLLDLKSGLNLDEQTVKPVVELVEALQDEKSAAAMTQFLGLLWRRRGNPNWSRFKEIASELREHRASSNTVKDLEDLAAALDQERAEISQRMRGV
jgi:lipopolysaccharide biosynthesis regulator YciM